MKKKQQWTKRRHRIPVEIVRPFFSVIAKRKYHASIEKFREEGNRNWLVLSNHQTDFDQFFLGLSFRKPLYYVAMEDLFSMGWISRAIEFLVAPIPILKASTDIKAIKTCLRVAKEGGNIALFPEGNRTYSGKSCYIKPGVAALAQKLGLPIAIYRLEGGYGVKPRWADCCRNGPMKGGVRRVIEPEEYRNMSREELYALICKELFVDESVSGNEYFSEHAAEGIEQVLYLCPDCGFTEFESEHDLFRCKHCGKEYRYLPNKQIEAVTGETPFSTMAAWYDHQEAFIRSADLSAYHDTPIFTDEADLLEIFVFKRKKRRQKRSPVRLYADRIEAEIQGQTLTMNFSDIRTMACVAGHKLNVFHKDQVYQFKGDKSFNALKYCNIYFHEKFIKEEHADGEFQFLGL